MWKLNFFYFSPSRPCDSWRTGGVFAPLFLFTKMPPCLSPFFPLTSNLLLELPPLRWYCQPHVSGCSVGKTIPRATAAAFWQPDVYVLVSSAVRVLSHIPASASVDRYRGIWGCYFLADADKRLSHTKPAQLPRVVTKETSLKSIVFQ